MAFRGFGGLSFALTRGRTKAHARATKVIDAPNRPPEGDSLANR